MKKVAELAPEAWLPGGKPDPLIAQKPALIGAPESRIDGPLKVRGEARFAAEVALDGMVYAALIYSTVAKGHIATLDTSAAEAAPGVGLLDAAGLLDEVAPVDRRERAQAADAVADRDLVGGLLLRIQLHQVLDRLARIDSLARSSIGSTPSRGFAPRRRPSLGHERGHGGLGWRRARL
ncbi:MAG: hypothetical protein WDW38_008603 [Sanguina aurantia]